jgi:hypothetical protein
VKVFILNHHFNVFTTSDLIRPERSTASSLVNSNQNVASQEIQEITGWRLFGAWKKIKMKRNSERYSRPRCVSGTEYCNVLCLDLGLSRNNEESKIDLENNFTEPRSRNPEMTMNKKTISAEGKRSTGILDVEASSCSNMNEDSSLSKNKNDNDVNEDCFRMWSDDDNSMSNSGGYNKNKAPPGHRLSDASLTNYDTIDEDGFWIWSDDNNNSWSYNNEQALPNVRSPGYYYYLVEHDFSERLDDNAWDMDNTCTNNNATDMDNTCTNNNAVDMNNTCTNNNAAESASPDGSQSSGYSSIKPPSAADPFPPPKTQLQKQQSSDKPKAQPSLKPPAIQISKDLLGNSLTPWVRSTGVDSDNETLEGKSKKLGGAGRVRFNKSGALSSCSESLSVAQIIGKRSGHEDNKRNDAKDTKSGYGVTTPIPGGPTPNQILIALLKPRSEQMSKSYCKPAEANKEKAENVLRNIKQLREGSHAVLTYIPNDTSNKKPNKDSEHQNPPKEKETPRNQPPKEKETPKHLLAKPPSPKTKTTSFIVFKTKQQLIKNG